MQYAKDRGIQFYVFTWNIFTFGAEGKYGITTDQTNQKTIDYFRASVREMVLTYPLLAGIGITAGEQMQELKGEFSKEKWLWKTYGEGIRDALKQQPGRQLTLIHRYHQTGQEEILNDVSGVSRAVRAAASSTRLRTCTRFQIRRSSRTCWRICRPDARRG